MFAALRLITHIGIIMQATGAALAAAQERKQKTIPVDEEHAARELLAAFNKQHGRKKRS